jgi:hypothetical protein
MQYPAVRMSPLSNVQFSRFSELEAAKCLTFGSGGGLEVALPMTDDNRRDMEIHLKDHFRSSVAAQVKARHVLVRRNRAEMLVIRFDEKRERLITSPYFWYFFGYMDLKSMRYQPPVFYIPSAVVHSAADPRPHGDMIRFTFAASMDPKSKDQWRPYACDPGEVAIRVMKFLRSQDRRKLTYPHSSLAQLMQLPGTLVVGRPR